MNKEFLIDWVSKATVDYYENGPKTVYIAKNGNEVLFFFADRYHPRWRPKVQIVWLKDGESKVVWQDIERNGDVIHSTGNASDDDYNMSSTELIEDLWITLIKTHEKQQALIFHI